MEESTIRTRHFRREMPSELVEYRRDRRCANTIRSLTHSLDSTKEGLAVNATQSHRTCSVEGCGSAHASRGFCTKHYKRFRRYGNPLMRRTARSYADTFTIYADKSGDCWEWTGTIFKSGYGKINQGRKYMLAHRWSYEHHIGPIPKGLVIDHLCRNRRCVNPDHLEAVTNLENVRRGAGYALINGMRTACINGHEYTPENTYVDPTRGTVRCRECARINDRKRVRR